MSMVKCFIKLINQDILQFHISSRIIIKHSIKKTLTEVDIIFEIKI